MEKIIEFIINILPDIIFIAIMILGVCSPYLISLWGMGKHLSLILILLASDFVLLSISS